MVNGFRVTLVVMWLWLLNLTIHAGLTLGWDKAGDFFFGDMLHPWRAQFNTDFFIVLLLIAAWMFWHARSRALGVLFEVTSVMFGGLFTLAYVLIQSFRLKGNMEVVLLGRHYRKGS